MIHEAMCRGPREGELFRSRVINPQEEIWDPSPTQVPPQNCNNNINIPDKNAFRRMKSDVQQVQPQQQQNQRIPVVNTQR